MTSKNLIEKIEALPPESKAEVEDFVDFLSSKSMAGARLSDDLLARMDARRERLLREHGRFDSVPILHELRESGGR